MLCGRRRPRAAAREHVLGRMAPCFRQGGVKMGKKKDGERKAKRKLAKAQLDLHIAQEKLVQARARGKQEIERARLRAARWSAKAAQEVERAAETVSRAETRVLGIQRSAAQAEALEERAQIVMLPDEQTAAGSG